LLLNLTANKTNNKDSKLSNITHFVNVFECFVGLIKNVIPFIDGVILVYIEFFNILVVVLLKIL